jgi:dynein light chain 1
MATAVPPPTTIKEAIARFEKEEYERRVKDEEAEAERDGREKREIPPVVATQERYVKLLGLLPPITKMDKEITALTACEHLALSTNAIEKIGPGLKELKNLKILSLGRNCIRKLEQLDIPQLEQLWISYNKIDKLSGLDKLKGLKILYMSNNQIASWSEIERLATQCPELTDVLFINNPIYTNAASEAEYRLMMLQRLPKLTKLDGLPVDPDEKEEADRRRTQS